MLFWTYVAGALAIFTFLVPPFQKADEPAHFQRAVTVANLDFVCANERFEEPYFMMERRFADLPDILHTWDVAFRADAKFDTAWLRHDFSDPALREQAPFFRFCSLSPTGYLPNAIGVRLGMPFQNPLYAFYLGRIFGALFFVLAAVWALKVVPEPYKLLVYGYAAIPMVLHQVGANSYDAVQLSLFPVAFAYLTKFLVTQGPIKPLDLGAFIAVLLWLNTIRLVAYLPLLLVFFAIRPSQVSKSVSTYTMIAGAFAIAAILSTALLGSVYLPQTEDTSPEGFGIDADAQTRFVLEHPWHFIAAMYKTLHVFGDLLLRESIFVGGWIDYGTNFALYYAVVFLAGAFVWYVASRERPLVRPYQTAVIFAAVGLTVVLLFFSLYAVWSPVGADAVSGLQGRYFVGLLPFTLFAAAQAGAVLGRERLLRLLALAVVLFVTWQVFRAVDIRYY